MTPVLSPICRLILDIVVTGASTGFGRALAELVLIKGEIAIATARRPESLSALAAQHPSDRLLVLKLDVTQPDEIAAAFAQAKVSFGRVDVVVNNAAIAVMGEVEAQAHEEGPVRGVFETNFWGAARVTSEAVRFFREVNEPVGGRLLQISSITGLIGGPGLAYYAASKHGEAGETLGCTRSRRMLMLLCWSQRSRVSPSPWPLSSTLRGTSRYGSLCMRLCGPGAERNPTGHARQPRELPHRGSSEDDLGTSSPCIQQPGPSCDAHA